MPPRHVGHLQVVLGACFLGGCAGAPAPARAVTRPTPTAAAERVNLDVVDEDLAEVVAGLGAQVGRRLLVDPVVQERVTVSLRDVPWRDAVYLLARMTRCDVEERSDDLLVLTQAQRITLTCSAGDLDARTAVQLVAAYHGLNVSLPDDLRGRLDRPDALTGDAREMVRQLLAPRGEFVLTIDEDASLLRIVGPITAPTPTRR